MAVQAGTRCRIAHEVWVEDVLAFESGEEVVILGDSPDSESRENRYIVHSAALDKTFLLREADLAPENPADQVPPFPPPVGSNRLKPATARTRMSRRKAIVLSLSLLMVLLIGLGVFLIIFLQNNARNRKVATTCVRCDQEVTAFSKEITEKEQPVTDALDNMQALQLELTQSLAVVFNPTYVQGFYTDARDAAAVAETWAKQFKSQLLKTQKEVLALECPDKSVEEARKTFLAGTKAYLESMNKTLAITDTIIGAGSYDRTMYYMGMFLDLEKAIVSSVDTARADLEKAMDRFEKYLGTTLRSANQ